MRRGAEQDDVLLRWLTGDGFATLDAITGGALDVIGVLDRDLVIRYVNWTVPGLTREDVVGHSVFNLVPPGYQDAARATYTEVLRTGIGTHLETMYSDATGLRIWDVRVGPIRFEGEVIGLVVITTEVTAQRRAGADRDRFFSLSLDMLVVAAATGHLKRINPAFGETLGYEMSEIIDTPFINLVHPDDRGPTVEAFNSVLRGNRVTDFENRYRRKDGQYRVFSWRSTVDPITGDVYAVARDITVHRTTEAQLHQAQKMDAVGQLAGGIAHDFNNLLQAILGNTALALEALPHSTDLEDYLHEIERAGRRASELTVQLLAFSRRQPLRLMLVDLNELVRNLMKMLRRLLPENIAIDSIAAPELASVSADPTQLEQVIVNLCVNARDAMEGGGRLTLETSNVVFKEQDRERHPWAKPGRYVVLCVTDTGLGMTDAVRERAFEPFFTTKSAHKGSGLGLSTVYGIVQQHDGMIVVDSEVGKGSTFRVYLRADTRVVKPVEDESRSPSPRGTETILLAEDEEMVRRAVVHILEGAGYRVLSAVNGLDAIRLLREHEEPVHLVVLDVVMPELGGPETWERLRSLRKDLRVLFTSGYADRQNLQRLPPNADVVAKPFRPKELLSRIRSKLDESPTRS